MWNIRVYRHFVTGEIMIYEQAMAFVDGESFHQRCANAHGHRADHLTTRRFWIENPTSGADREHSTHTNFSGSRVHADLYEMRAKGRLLVGFVEAAILDGVFRNDFAISCCMSQRCIAIAPRDLPLGKP